jgi:very-short-patch-repair endonuclease
MSLPERLLWAQLRRKRDGLHWRKQHPAGEYDLDFYCDAAKLCVEVDGEAHDRGRQPHRDACRDAWLAAHSIFTVRVPAREVLANLERALALIDSVARERAPLHRPADGPPPPDKLGEELQGTHHHIRKTPKRGISGIGALSVAAKARPSTSRV